MHRRLLVVKSLLEAGCIKKHNNCKPLEMAIECFLPEYAKLLIENGVRIDGNEALKYERYQDSMVIHEDDIISALFPLLTPSIDTIDQAYKCLLSLTADIPAVAEYFKTKPLSPDMLEYFQQNPRLLLNAKNPLELGFLFADRKLLQKTLYVIPAKKILVVIHNLQSKYSNQPFIDVIYLALFDALVCDRIPAINLELSPIAARSLIHTALDLKYFHAAAELIRAYEADLSYFNTSQITEILFKAFGYRGKKFHPVIMRLIKSGKVNMEQRINVGYDHITVLQQAVIHYAIDHRVELKAVEALLQLPTANIQVLNQDGNSLLHEAINFLEPKLTQLLIQYGVDLFHKNKKSRTPFEELLYLARPKHDIKKFLLHFVSDIPAVVSYLQGYDDNTLESSRPSEFLNHFRWNTKLLIQGTANPLEFGFLFGDQIALESALAYHFDHDISLSLLDVRLADLVKAVTQKYPKYPFLITDSLKFLRDRRPNVFTDLHNNPKKLLSLPNPLQLGCLMKNHLDIATLVIPLLSDEKAESAIDDLKSNYPEQSKAIEKLYKSYSIGKYTIDLFHIENYAEIPIEPCPPDIDFSKDLVDIFDLLNFKNPQEQHYIDPKKVTGNEEETFWTLDSMLADGIMIMMDSRVYSGTPQAGTNAFKNFYNTLRNAVYATGKQLKQLPWEKARPLAETWLLKLFESIPYCAGRLNHTVITQHAMIVGGKQDAYSSYLSHISGQLRTITLDRVVAQLVELDIVDDEFHRTQTVHASGQCMSDFGEEYKIPGYPAFRDFDDPYSHLNENQLQLAKEMFLTLYNDPSSFLDWMKDDIWHNENVRKLFITWAKTNVPASFQIDKYYNIFTTIESWKNGKNILDTQYRSLAVKDKEAIDTLFANENIFIKSTQTCREAIDEDKSSEYCLSIYETIEENGRSISRIKWSVILRSLITEGILRPKNRETTILLEEKKEREEKLQS